MTNQHDAALELAEELLEDIELARVGAVQLLYKSARLARLTNDQAASTWIHWEINGYEGVPRAEANHSLRESHRMTEENKAYLGSLADLVTLTDALRGSLAAKEGTGSTNGDWAFAVQQKYYAQVNESTRVLIEYGRVISAVMSRMHGFVSSTYHELRFSQLQASMYEHVRNQVDASMAEASTTTLAQIESINERLVAGDGEAVSQALNTCRRLITRVCDAIYPARDCTMDVDGQPLALGRDRIKNRYSAYAFELGVSKSRRDRLRRSLSDLYERTSAGVQSDVTSDEARFLFIQTYLIVGEYLSLSAQNAGDTLDTPKDEVASLG